MILSIISRNDDPPDEPDPACEVCCFEAGSCICPPCPHCGERGNLYCYSNERTDFRIPINREQAIARIRARADAYEEAAGRDRQYADYIENDGGETSPHIEDYPTTI